MSGVSNALKEINDVFVKKDEASKSRTVDQLTDLFLAHAPVFSDMHVALFDQVISLLTDAIETRARARLSERLADIENAPNGVVRKLSKDTISVARPVLSRSVCLSEKDLMDAARSGGRDHMLAISERRDLSEPVTDILVSEGDRVVINAVASNPTARFSAKGYDVLVFKSRSDALLQSALGRRSDIPRRHMAALFELAKSAARERLSRDGVAAQDKAKLSQAVDASALEIVQEAALQDSHLAKAFADVTPMMESGALDEAALQEFCRKGKLDHAVAAFALLANLPVDMIRRAMFSADNDMLLILGRSTKLEWLTVRAVFAARQEHRPGIKQLELLADNYAKLTLGTAQRVLRFLHARETSAVKRA